MAGHAGLGQPQNRRELAHVQALGREEAEHAEARLVGQRPKEGRDISHIA